LKPVPKPQPFSPLWKRQEEPGVGCTYRREKADRKNGKSLAAVNAEEDYQAIRKAIDALIRARRSRRVDDGHGVSTALKGKNMDDRIWAKADRAASHGESRVRVSSYCHPAAFLPRRTCAMARST